MSKFVLLLALVAFVAAAPAPEAVPAPVAEAAAAPLIEADVAVVAAAPAAKEEEEKKVEVIPILKSESDQSDDGSYSFMFESGDGSFRQEKAVIIDQGTDEESIKITGSYKYTDANGEEVLVNYTADKNGFVPVGTIISKEISDNALAAKDLPKQVIAKVEKEDKEEKIEQVETVEKESSDA